jgi:PAS domain S-box-containing protein
LKFAWVGWLDVGTGTIRPVGLYGTSGEWLTASGAAAEPPVVAVPTGTALREGRSVICNEITPDSASAALCEAATEHGFGSAAAFAIFDGGRASGVLSVYAEESGFFRDKEILLFEEAAGDVGFALDHIQQEAERQRSEKALAESEAKYRALVDNAGEVIYVAQDGRVKFANPQAASLSGYSTEELTARPFIEFLHAEDRTRVLEHHLARLEGRELPRTETCRIVQRSGETRWVQLSGTRIQWEGKPATLNFLSDITERRQAEERVREALEQKTALLKEVHHRVKNNLQVMTSLINLQARQVKSPEALAALQDTQARLRAMALLHETLYSSGRMDRVECGQYIDYLCHCLAQTFGVERRRIAIENRVTPATFSLAIDQAVTCGLIVNEMVSNACKHAFPAGQHGVVSVELFLEGEALACVRVADTGVGLPEDINLESRETLGLQLISGLARQLGGVLTLHRKGGTCFEIRFKPREDEERTL